MESSERETPSYALSDDIAAMSVLDEHLSLDVITNKMLTQKSMVRAYDSIKPIMRDLNRTLSRHPEVCKQNESVDTPITMNIVLDEQNVNYISLKPYKHHVENFIHIMSQLGFRIWYSGIYGSTNVPTHYKILTEVSELQIYVKHSSMSLRHQWACALITSFIFEAMTTLFEKVHHEMESEPKQAIEDTMEETEVINVAENTEITQEVDDSKNMYVTPAMNFLLQEISTTEPLARLSPIAERFVRIFDSSQTFNVTDTINMNKLVLDIPNGLYSFFDSTIVSALRSYTLIKTDVELLIKVNANQAQCGRYVVSSLPCEKQLASQQSRGSVDGVYRMLQRDHAIVDLSKSNDVYYTMTYENLRPWLPIQTDEVGTLVGGSFATARMRCLSRLRIADSGNPICPYQVFARLKNTVLAGMRFPTSVPVGSVALGSNDMVQHEMEREPQPPVIDAMKNVVTGLKAIPAFGSIFNLAGRILGNGAVSVAKVLSSDQSHVKVFEQRLNYIGMINKDRPIDITHPTPLLPLPVHSFSFGRTPYHSKKLRLEPEATVPHLPSHHTINDTQNVLDIARTPGYITRFNINETTTQGDLLCELPVIPYDPRYRTVYPTTGSANTATVPPVTYISLMYNQSAGSLVYEFVPVKTPSHNFSIQVGFIPFNGIPGEVTETQLQSCRWKVIDFRTSENGEFTVPWLSTSVVRMTPFEQAGYFSANTDFIQIANVFNDTADYMKDPGKIVVRLVNELNPTPIVTPEIEVLVFVKAHENMRFMSPTTFKAPQVFIPRIDILTRGYGDTTDILQPSIIPTYRVGNFDFNQVVYEMQRNPEFQHGDEQTMPGNILREAPGPYVQTMEDHHNILDVCRRFYFNTTVTGIFSSKVGATTTSPFPPFAVIPITPYSMQSENAFGTGRFQRNTPLQTPRDALLSCFRWMRGSLNLTIHSLTNIPLEIAFLPPVGFPYGISGQHGPYLFESNDTFPIYSVPQMTGNPTEILDPRVNPIQTIEVPFYNVNNFIDLQATMVAVSSNLAAGISRDNLQDIASLFLGTLVIRGINGNPISTSNLEENNFKVRVSMAFGDDCIVKHFIGTPPLNMSGAAIRWNMVETPDAFRNRNRTREEVKTSLIMAGIESNPGPVLTSLFGFESLSSSFTHAKSMASEFKNIISAPYQIQKQIEQFKHRGIGFVDEVKNILAAYTVGMDVLQITSLALSIVASLHKSTNVYALLSVICQIFAAVGIFNSELVSMAISKLSTMVMGSPVLGDPELKHEMESDSLLSMASVFSGLIIETFMANHAIDKKKFNLDENYIQQVFINTFKNFNVMRAGALCILMTRICGAVKTLYGTVRKWLRGLEKHDILTDDPEFIRGFMKDYEFFMDERNLSGHSLIQRHRDRFWITILTAYYLRAVLATVDKKHVNTTLATAVKDVITRANTLKSHMMAPPVRYEPFSLWFWGAPGTGKSTMMQQLTIDMAKNIGCVLPGNPIYVRSPHSAWWNGYDNQPIVLIDDANGVNDPTILGRTVSEFQAMKTSAQMRIEMPRLEEKNAEMTSIILGVCSNVSEWISSMIVDQNAFRRRRDMVVQVMWTKAAMDYFIAHPNLVKSVSSLPEQMVQKSEHIVFAVHNSPTDSTQAHEIYSKEQFEILLLQRHKSYHNVEVDRMMKRYEKSLELSKQLSEKVMDRATLKSALIGVLLGCESTEVMSETMKRQLFELENVNPSRYNQLPLHTKNILQQMKRTEGIRHEAPGMAEMVDIINMYEHASEWFKTTLFPSYSIGDEMFSETIKEFMPWRYEEQRTFNTDLITTECVSCSEPHDIVNNGIAYVCYNSVGDNQHWICTKCKPAFDAANNNKSCPTCRASSLVRISQQQNDWRWYMKVTHFAKTSAKKLLKPLVVTLDFLWENATTIVALSMMTSLTYFRVSQYLDIAAEMDAVNEGVARFLTQYGMLPTTYYYTGDKLWFQVDDVLYEEVNGNFCVHEVLGHEGPKKDKNIVPIPIAGSSSSESDRECYTPVDIDYLKHITKVDCTPEHSNEDDFILARKRPIHYEDGNFVVNVKKGEEMETLLFPAVACKDENCRLNSHMTNMISSFYSTRIGTWNDSVRRKQKPFSDDDPVPEFIQKEFLEAIGPVPVEQSSTWYIRMVTYQRELYDTLRGKFLSWFTVIYEHLCTKWKVLIGFITLIFALYYGIKYYYTEEEGIILEPQHEGASQPRETARGRAQPNTRLYVKPNNPATHEMKMVMNNKIPENVQNIANIVLKNQFSISCAGFTVQGVALRNNYGWFPRHSFYLFAQLQEAGEVIVFKQGDISVVLKDRFGMSVVEDNVVADYVIFHHKQLTGRDLRSHIFTTVQNTVAYPSYAYGVDLQEQKIVPVHITSVTQVDPAEAKEITTPWTVKGKTYSYTSKLIEYLTIVGFRGDGKCGSPMISAEGKIIAIHFAGAIEQGTNVGYSAPVFREMFMFGEATDSKHEMPAFPNLKLYSRYPNPPYHTHKSKLQPSAIADRAWPSLTVPCIQSPNDPKYTFGASPLLDGAATIGAPTNSPKRWILDQAISAVAEELIQYMPTPAMPPPVSIYEAITAQNHSNVEPMNLKTSAGLPWIADFPNKNLKSDYITHDVFPNGTHKIQLAKVFLQKYKTQWQGRTIGVPPREPFWAHLKDERRKPEKAYSFGGTRVFNVSPLELVLSSRRALLPMMDAFHSDPVRLHHAIGLSPDSIQWTQLIESLRRKSDKIVQLDFKKFSDSMPWEFVQGAFYVIIAYYDKYNLMTPELWQILQTVFYEITHSLLLVEGQIYELLNGVLQGHPLTSLINSIVNIIEQVYVWIDITDAPGSVFFKECGIVVMGDDVVISIPKSRLRLYNGQTISAKFGELNIVVTDENKQVGVISRNQNINRFDFLSCSYYLHPYRALYLAPSDPESIFDTALWIKRKDGPFLDATRENVEQSLMNSFGHGPCIYEMYRATLQFLTGFEFRSWFELDYIFYCAEGDPERSVVLTNLGVVTGTSPKSFDQLEARVGRTGKTTTTRTNQYFDVDFLSTVKLDTQGIVTGKYECRCRYNCEKELLERIKHVETATNTPRSQFLPFTSQEEGTRILGAVIDVGRTVKPRGYPSIIAVKSYVSVTSDSTVGDIDGTRDRVQILNSSTEKEKVGLQIISSDQSVIVRPGA